MEAIKRTWWLFAIIFLLWVFYPFMISSDLIKVWKPWLDWTTRGQLGDSFGALNTLFSGLALAGLGVNIYLQGVQIKKLEVKEQQNEDQLRAQAEALRITALLNFYTSEVERYSKGISELALYKPVTKEEIDDKAELKATILENIKTSRRKRQLLVDQLTGESQT